MESDINSDQTISLVGCILSILGSVVVIFAIPTLWRHSPPGTMLYDRIVLALSSVDFLLSINQVVQSLTLPRTNNKTNVSDDDVVVVDDLCQVTATFRNMFTLLQLFLITLFGVELGWNVIWGGPANAIPTRKHLEGSPLYKWRWTVAVVLFVVASIPSMIPLFGTDFARYEPLSAWCWIGSHYVLARQLLFYVFLYVCLITTTTFYVIVIYKSIMSHLESQSTTSLQPHIFKLSLFPLVFILSWVPAIVCRIYEAVSPDEADHLVVLDYLVSAQLPLSGFFNFVLYCVTRKILTKAFLSVQQDKERDESLGLVINEERE